jgi:hypothetical protein
MLTTTNLLHLKHRWEEVDYYYRIHFSTRTIVQYELENKYLHNNQDINGVTMNTLNLNIEASSAITKGDKYSSKKDMLK